MEVGLRCAQAAPWPADGAQKQRRGRATARKSSFAAIRAAVRCVAMNGARGAGVQGLLLSPTMVFHCFILIVTFIITRILKIIMIRDPMQQRRGCLASSVRAALREQRSPADGAQKQRHGRATFLPPQCRRLWKQGAQKQRRGRPTARNRSAVVRRPVCCSSADNCGSRASNSSAVAGRRRATAALWPGLL